VTNAEVVETQMQTVKKLAVLPSGATAGTGGENTQDLIRTFVMSGDQEDWNKYVVPENVYVINNMDPVMLIDILREKTVLSNEEYTKLLTLKEVKENCSRELVHGILRFKPNSFKEFLEALNRSGQNHIVRRLAAKAEETSRQAKGKGQNKTVDLMPHFVNINSINIGVCVCVCVCVYVKTCALHDI
jgi:hypothetical protein